MASRHRPPSPPYGRRYVPPERTSTGSFAPSSSYDQNYERTRRDSRDSYTSPRSSNDRVIPVSTETYRNGSLVSSTRPPASDASSSRRAPVTSSTAAASTASSRTSPPVIHQPPESSIHATSRQPDRYARNGDYYVTPSSSAADQGHHRHRHRRTASIDDEQRPPAMGSRERNDPDFDHNRRRSEQRYHLTGPSTYRPTSIDEEGGYEYATPREVFENTEPKRHRARRGSADAPDRDRPTSMIESHGPAARPLGRENAPPPATRALERINGGTMSRHGSITDSYRSPPRHRDRERHHNAYNSEDDDYYVEPRTRRPKENSATQDRKPPYSPTRTSATEDRRDSLRPSRRYEDTDVVNRGFGIRAASVEPPRSSDENLHSQSRYSPDQPVLPPDFSIDSRRMEPRRRDHDPKYPPADRESDAPRKRDKEPAYDRSRDVEPSNNAHPPREHHYPQPPARDRYVPQEYKNRDQIPDQGFESSKPRERPPTERTHKDESNATASGALATAGIAGAAALASQGAARRSSPPQQDTAKHGDVREPPAPESSRPERRPETPDEIPPRERHYVTRDDSRDDARNNVSPPSMDPDEEYRLRVQKEIGRAKRPQAESRTNGDDSSPSRTGPSSRAPRDDDNLETDSDGSTTDSRALAVRNDHPANILEEPLTDEPAVVVENRENRVRIVEPPREKDKPKGILRKPTEKFPEYPDTIREGVAPHKDDKRDIPQGTKWTKISREVVNPQALEEAGERFEERKDFVIVLRAITREQVQKLADRTNEIRKEREHRHGHHRDRRHRTDEDRRNKDEDDDYDDSEADEETKVEKK